jgi:ATP-dependent RNA helicase DeaD
MRDGRARVCVATDVAARGIDLPNLNLVIHADLPTNTESLLHRSGRTGRAGRKGISAMIVPAKATKKAERLLQWAKIKAEWTVPPSADEIRTLDEDRLLGDPLWDEPLSDGETAFAARLLERQSPEVIAAAYLRLYRAGRSAPEELLPPDTKPERKERQSFGPGTWFSLSVGRDDKAEPRWILPLLCRSGGLDKSAIGAIRTQAKETYVELTTASVPAFLQALGPDGVLEDGVVATQMDAAPDLSQARAPAFKPSPSGPARKKPAKPRPVVDRQDPGPTTEPVRPKKPAAKPDDRPRAKPDAQEARPKPRAAEDKPVREGKKKRWTPEDRSRNDRAEKPTGKPTGKPSDKPRGKPAGKFAGKPGGKPAGKFARKPDGTSEGKPAGKARGKAPAKSRTDQPDARDSSKRFVPPGSAKPGARKPRQPGQGRKGGDQPPRRKKP